MAFVTFAGGFAAQISSHRERAARPLRVRRFIAHTPLRHRLSSRAVWCATAVDAAETTTTAPSESSSAFTEPPKILICGAPASGKGTQCQTIVEHYGVVHISTGEMLRAAVAAGTELGKQAMGFMDSGELVPDQLVISMLVARLREQDCAERGWLLDGFPRTGVQAEALISAEIVPRAVVVLDVPEDVLIERVVGRRIDPDTGSIYNMKFNPPTSAEVAARLVQRSDDTEEKAKVRIGSFNRNRKAVEEQFAESLVRVDGNRAKKAIFEDIRAVIDESLEIGDGGCGNVNVGTERGNGVVQNSEYNDVEENTSTKGIPVAEFVRRAEEAYEKGLLTPENVNWSGQAAMDGPDSDGVGNLSDVFARPILALGDALALVLFAYMGRASHGHPVPDVLVLKTAFPFLTSWFAISPFLGAYTRDTTQNVKGTAAALLFPWAVSMPVGIGIRAIATQHSPPVPFVVITLISTAVILTAWRAVYVKVRGTETDTVRRAGPLEGIQMVTNLLRRW